MKRASDYTRELASGIADLEARKVTLGDRVADWLVAGIVGVLGALALLHWFASCWEGPTC